MVMCCAREVLLGLLKVYPRSFQHMKNDSIARNKFLVQVRDQQKHLASKGVENLWSKRFSATLKKGILEAKTQKAESQSAELTLGQILLRLKTAKKASDDRISINLLVQEVSKFWSGETNPHHEPSILKICQTAAFQMFQKQKEAEEAERRKKDGAADLLVRLERGMQLRIAQVENDSDSDLEEVDAFWRIRTSCSRLNDLLTDVCTAIYKTGKEVH